MEVAVAGERPSRGVVRREEWRRRGSGGLQHTSIEATHWTAPNNSYGKVVEGVSCVGADGRSLRARRQIEVLSARGPGLLQVLTSTHTSSHSHSSTTTGFNKNFDDLQLSVHQLDVSPQKDRLSVGRSGAMGARRPPSKFRPQIEDGTSTVSRLRSWFDVDQLQSPSIVANGSHKVNGSMAIESGQSAEIVNSASDKTVNSCKTMSSKESEDSLYDSCPEKESVFKDESDQLEEWRRASKIRRSLQYPGRTTRTNTTKPIDLPDNWGSVSRIKKELESAQSNSWFSKNGKSASLNMILDEPKAEKSRPEDISEEPEINLNDDILIKPSTLKKKSFIDLETLNELRGKLKTVSNHDKHQRSDLDDGIEAETNEKHDVSEDKVSVPNVRSYVFGMEAALNQNKPTYSLGTNSLESRVSKLINGMSHRNDDWHARRKSYGFEKVTNQKIPNQSLSSHEKNNMESSTDSGICRSTEVVNSISSTMNGFKNENLHPMQHSASRSTIITLGNNNNPEKSESFESWLMNNRKPFGGSYSRYLLNKNDQNTDIRRPSEAKTYIAQSSNQISISIQDEAQKENKTLQRLSEERDNENLNGGSGNFLNKSEEYALKRHTIAVDGFKALGQINDYTADIFEKKNKKVEFCKTEVHFTADSGKVNIVETDGKPPSTNNFRRRRRNSSAILQKESNEKSNLPMTHFGDSLSLGNLNDLKTNEVECKEPLKLNYAIITDIKSASKESDLKYDATEGSLANGSEEISEGEAPRGILKNKPVKPKPYHLGEDKNVLSEINNTGYIPENNVWGIKLKPIQNRSDALWTSSVTLKNDSNDIEFNGSEQTGYGKIGKSFSTTSLETKGYSTKINFGNGTPIVESSFENKSNHISKDKSEHQKDTNPAAIVSKYLNYSSNPLYKDELKPVISKSMTNESKSSFVKSNFDDKDSRNTFADSISTPRSLMPTRGSARKLKEHELSYFGVTASENQNSLKRQPLKITSSEKQSLNTSAILKNDLKCSPPKIIDGDHINNPIYENVNLKKSNDVSMKRIRSGESIIDELTKAADEILQALNDFSDEDSVNNHCSKESDNQKTSQPLATISERSMWNDKSKASEHKAVQTIIGGTKRYSSMVNNKSNKTRTSSNSSLESISRETLSKEKKKQPPIEIEKDIPEKPLRKKSYSGDVVKARRLQRASSREALLTIHGSSSEDIAGHLEVTRKKTTRRSKHSTDSLKREDSKSSLTSQPYTRSIERKKESRTSTKYITSLVPEIRHKTTISTIMNLGDRTSSSDKTKSSHERSRHKERIREGTISSMARDLLKLKERSRSTDTSLERDHKERKHRKERSHKSTDERSKHSESDKLKKISEESDDKEKRNKFITAKKSSVSATNSASVRNIQRGSQAGRAHDRLNAGSKVTNTRTEYDKNLRLI